MYKEVVELFPYSALFRVAPHLHAIYFMCFKIDNNKKAKSRSLSVEGGVRRTLWRCKCCITSLYASLV